MPDKPLWYGDLQEVIAALRRLPFPWVDRATLQDLLGVGSRRAQQILAPCVTRKVGTSGVAAREDLIAYLERISAGDRAYYERQRRRRVAAELDRFRREWLEKPRLLVEAPAAVARRDLDSLPEGIAIRPGSVTVTFQTATEALEKFLALAMAIGKDYDRFERIATDAAPAFPPRADDRED